MALIAAHLTKVSVEHLTHNPVAAHISKEAVRQASRRGRRSTLKLTKGNHHTASPRSSKGFNPRAARVSTRGASMRSSGARMAMAHSAFGHGGFGSAFGGFHGK